jgi:hypothetical protein
MKCSECAADNDRAPQRYCSTCHAAYQRRWRKQRTEELRALRAAAGRMEAA